MKKLFLAALLVVASLSAQAANYFHWDMETATMTVTSGTTTPQYAGGGARVTTQSHSATHAMSTLNSVGSDQPSGINAPASPDLNVTYPWPVLNSRALYYKWWMRIPSDFNWSNGSKAKVKINRVGITNTGATGNGLIYTGYMSVNGFDLSEGYWAGSDSAIQSGGDHFAKVDIAGGMATYADNTWHEYIWKVKPNTTATAYDGQFQVWIDGVSQGSYTAFKLVGNGTEQGAAGNWVNNNGSTNMQEKWAAVMLAPYWQCTGAACTGTIYVDDWSTDDVFSSAFGGGADTTAPVVTITSPTSASTWAQSTSSITLSGTATDNTAVTSLTWINGTCGSGTATTVDAFAHWTFTTGLCPGSNALTVNAFDAAGNGSNDVLTVTYVAGQTPAAIIWQDDFETDKSASYFGVNAPSSPGSFGRSSTTPISGATSLRSVTVAANASNSTWWLGFGLLPANTGFPDYKVPAGVDSTTKFQDITASFDLRSDVGWPGNADTKLARISAFVDSSGSQMAVCHLWASSQGNVNQLMIDPARGTNCTPDCLTSTSLAVSGWNDIANFTFMNGVSTTTAVLGAAKAGVTQHIDFRMKLNTPGQSDGLCSVAIDGVVEASAANLNFRGSLNTYGINTVHLERYFNAGAPAGANSEFDNLVIKNNVGGPTVYLPIRISEFDALMQSVAANDPYWDVLLLKRTGTWN